MLTIIMFILFGVSLIFSGWFAFVVVYDAYKTYLHEYGGAISPGSKIGLTERAEIARHYLVKSFWYHFPKP